MSKHTPGPWVIEYENDTGPSDEYFAEWLNVGPAQIHGDVYSEQVKADAALVAAAPDLLTACELHINTLASQLRNGKEDPAFGEAIYQAQKMMQAAIAKARGEA